jgi:hypothetical protein
MIDAILSNHVLAGVSREILHRTMKSQRLNAVRLSAKEKDLSLDFE